jgi:hypothetical protein
MKSLTTRRFLISSILAVLLAAVTVTGLDRFGRNCRVFGSTGGLREQHIVKKLVDDPRDAYRLWKEAGYRGRTVVFVSDRWESFNPGELIPAQMFRAYPLQLYNTAKLLEDENLSGVTFLYVASMHKICRGIVAILPEIEIIRMQGVARKAKDNRVSDKGVFVSRQGYPRWFTTAAFFSGPREPVLLYIGASYFKQAEPDELYRQLSASGLLTDCIILCNETGKETVTQIERSKLISFARLIGLPKSPAESDGKISSNARNPLPAIPTL